MQNSVNHAPGLKCKVCPRLLSEVIKRLVFLVVTTGQREKRQSRKQESIGIKPSLPLPCMSTFARMTERPVH